MSYIVDNTVLPVVCPKCGAQIQKSVVWFRQDSELGCPCGPEVTKRPPDTDKLGGAPSEIPTSWGFRTFLPNQRGFPHSTSRRSDFAEAASSRLHHIERTPGFPYAYQEGVSLL